VCAVASMCVGQHRSITAPQCQIKAVICPTAGDLLQHGGPWECGIIM